MVGKKAVLMLVLLSLGMVAGTFQPAQSAKTATIDFEGLAEGDIVSSLRHGEGISGVEIEGEITVKGFNPNFPGNPPDEPPNTAMIFDANCEGGCSGEDYDLDFSRDNLGNGLIISEDLDPGDPDDAAGPGEFYFEFDFTKFGNGTVNLKKLTYADIDGNEPTGLIKVYKGDQLKREVDLPRTGDNKKGEALIDENDIDRLEVRFYDSMMIDNIEIETESNGYIYYLPMANNDLDLFNVTIGYEDRALNDEERLDYDYNDWAVSIWTKFTGGFIDEDTIILEKITFNIIPKARGAKIDHQFYLRIDANTFNSDGVYELVIKGKPGVDVRDPKKGDFIASEGEDIPINFLDSGCDCEAFGVDTGEPHIMYNVKEGDITEVKRTAELSITFDTPFEFDFPDPDYEEHCQDLFFDPHLKVEHDGKPDEISWKPKDRPLPEFRILCVEDPNWQWPEEGVRIDRAYPDVMFNPDPEDPDGPPRPDFPPDWYTRNKATDCVFDGRPCSYKR